MLKFAPRHWGRITDILGAILCSLMAWGSRHGAMVWVAWASVCLVSARFDWTGRMLRMAWPSGWKKRMATMGLWLVLHKSAGNRR